MDTRLLNSLHNSDKKYKIVAKSKDPPSWNSSPSDDGSDHSPQSDETVEDYDTTLSNWRRHVASLPMSDSEDYNDVLQESPRFTPTDYNQHKSEDYNSVSEIVSTHNNSKINSRKMRGDNRQMDNDNTSVNGKFYATIDSVVYELDGDPSQKYIAYHGNDELRNHFITNAIQIITVDPESLDVSDSECESDADDESECGSDEEDEVFNHEEEACNEPENEACNSEQDEERVETEDHQSNYNEENFVNDASSVHKDESENTNVNISVDNNQRRRSILKSVSLPPSPCHNLDLNSGDYHSSFTFEDLKMTAFGNMLVSPMKVFNKNYDLPDVFGEAAPQFPDNITFDPVIPLNIKSNKDSDLDVTPECNDSRGEFTDIKLDDTPTNGIIDNIIITNGMIEKVMNSSDLLFDNVIDDSALGDDMHSFDLPKFIMSESPNQSNSLLKDTFDSSPVKEMRPPASRNNSIRNNETPPRLVLSTPKKPKISKKIISSESYAIDNNEDVKLKEVSHEFANGYDDFINGISEKGVSLGDADDYVDVETVSDSENIPVLAANNLDSLLEQFEASENIHKKAPGNSQWETISPTKYQDEDIGVNNASPNVDPVSAVDPSSESVHMDHDYCSPVKKSSHWKYTSPSTADESDNNSPNVCYKTPVNTKPTVTKTKIGLGMGKNIAMCMEYRTDEFKDPEISTNIKSKKSCRSDVSDSDCSIGDHSYSKVDYGKQKNVTNVANKPIKNNDCVKISRDNNSVELVKNVVSETVVDIACDKNIKKSVVVAFDHKVVRKNNKPPNGSGLLHKNNRNKVTDQIKSSAKQKQSLLKPAVKEEIKKVSLLKSASVLKVEELKPIVNVGVQSLSETVPPTEVTTVASNDVKEAVKVIEAVVPLKRKLNLEEYKKRRGMAVRSCEGSRASSPLGLLSTDIKTFSSPNSPVHHGETVATEPVKSAPVQAAPAVLLLNKELQLSSNVENKKSEPKLFDPIAEASKKALQLKKIASQRCSEDKIVKSKIPKLDNVVILPIATKNGVLLPMIKKTDDNVADDVVVPPVKRKNSQYEEIVMVSIGVNTDPVVVQEPEVVVKNVTSKDSVKGSSIQFKITKKGNSLIQTNVFGSNNDDDIDAEDATKDENNSTTQVDSKSAVIANHSFGNKPVQDANNASKEAKIEGSILKLNETLQKVEKMKDFKITSNSLIASIQKVVNKKRLSSKSPESADNSTRHAKVVSQIEKVKVSAVNETEGLSVVENSKQDDCKSNTETIVQEHGEDKVIMHLKKDRIKPSTHSISSQTDFNIIIKDVHNKENVPTTATQSNAQAVDDVNNLKSVSENHVSKDESRHGRDKGRSARHYRRKRSRSTSNESSHNISRNSDDRKRIRNYSNSSRRTRSNDRNRRSYSPIRRSRYRSRSRSRSRRSGRYNRDRSRRSRDNYKRSSRDSRYRRSRSHSRDRRRRSSRDRRRSDRSYSPVRSDRYRSRSRDNHNDHRSMRSSGPVKSNRSSVGSYERRRNSSRCSRSRSHSRSDRGVSSGVTSNVPECIDTTLKAVGNGERSRTHSESSATSTSSSSSSSSSSTSSSSSSSSSYSSTSSVFHSEKSYDRASVDGRHRSLVKQKPNPKPLSPRKLEPMEERRVVFIGRLEKTMTKEQMRRMFSRFGYVREVTLHRKDDGSRYGFVTFNTPQQSYNVVECASKDAELQRYDVSFGGRRAFCRHLYADLDDLEALEDPEYYGDVLAPQPIVVRKEASSFDALLQQMKQAVEAKKAKEKTTDVHKS